MRANLRLGTRHSALAMSQANWTRDALRSCVPALEIELVPIRTTGDRILDVPLSEVGGKGLFTKEIDEALLEGRIDFAVHSLKDLPFDLAEGTMLAANGWIYPTDSSINVAIAQGGHVQPKPLSLEAQGADGRWTVVHADLGFPAGKNKTVLIDLGGVGDARRVRLRTNLEISWDWLALASAADVPLRTARLLASRAELGYRGFSETTSARGEAPETPEYDRIANTAQRWRDLEGYHTRFGDVKELLASVDDRYVIMNAGDEMRLLFPEQPPPPEGWRRDFVLIGDGWEKDGDYNTAFSQTVLPLPSHDDPAYRARSASAALEDDPVYRRHNDDWAQYHTRFVAPDAFVRGLWSD